MYTVMIIEDDNALCAQVAAGLQKWGYSVVAAKDFENILQDFVRNKPQLVIMDINLPSFDGYYWCRKIRELSRVPVLFLSSRDTGSDVIMAVNTGADDYITKPFSISVLVAKIQALLRRAYDYTSGTPEIIEHKGVILYPGESVAIYSEHKIELTKNELKILSLLLNNKGTIVSRDTIMQILWNDDVFVNENTLTVNINRLRNKLTDVGLTDFINTRKGQGYIIS